MASLEADLGVSGDTAPEKRISRRRRRAHSTSSEEEDNDRRRVSFLNHPEGSQPFSSISTRYRAVDIKHFKHIFYGTFKVEHLLKLSNSILQRRTVTDDDSKPSEP